MSQIVIAISFLNDGRWIETFRSDECLIMASAPLKDLAARPPISSQELNDLNISKLQLGVANPVGIAIASLTASVNAASLMIVIIFFHIVRSRSMRGDERIL